VSTRLRRIRRLLISDDLWHPMTRLAYRVIDTTRSVCADARQIGLRQRVQLERDMNARERVRTLRLPGFRSPLFYRAGTSDPKVILQVFASKEYQCVADEAEVSTVIDCGANIGCTTFYLAHRYPRARFVVVEPDSANMELCRRNLHPFKDRVTFVQAGVWSSATPMVVERGKYRDGAAWSIQVRPTGAGEVPDFEALTVSDLMQRAGFERIDLLKVDIEAAEIEVFRAAEWLDRVRTLVIELHGPECEQSVCAALGNYVYQAGRSGELSIYRGIQRLHP
jgi:FkbM family methyltransferase